MPMACHKGETRHEPSRLVPPTPGSTSLQWETHRLHCDSQGHTPGAHAGPLGACHVTHTLSFGLRPPLHRRCPQTPCARSLPAHSSCLQAALPTAPTCLIGSFLSAPANAQLMGSSQTPRLLFHPGRDTHIPSRYLCSLGRISVEHAVCFMHQSCLPLSQVGLRAAWVSAGLAHGGVPPAMQPFHHNGVN